MHVILWRFRVRAGREVEFEAAYDENGTWVRFFRSDPAFLGSELMRGSDGTYLALDRWASEDAYRSFRDAHAEAYAELDARCEALTIEETLIGAVEA